MREKQPTFSFTGRNDSCKARTSNAITPRPEKLGHSGRSKSAQRVSGCVVARELVIWCGDVRPKRLPRQSATEVFFATGFCMSTVVGTPHIDASTTKPTGRTASRRVSSTAFRPAN